MKDLLTRHGSVIVAISVVLTGAALWALLVSKLEFGPAEAVLVTGLALLCLAQLHLYRDRTRASKTIKSELEGIMALSHDLLGDVAALREDVGDMRNRIGERNFLHADKIANQVEAMDQVVQRFELVQEERLKTEERIAGEVGLLADTVRRKMDAAAPIPVAEKPATRDEEPDADNEQVAPPRRSVRASTAKPSAPAAPAKSDLSSRVAGAISDSRIDLYLQPIVTLPQRKVRYYEALTRLRDEEGHIITPGDYMPAAHEAGMMTEIDNALLYRSISLVRRLVERKREVGVFCNISASTLLDSGFFPQFIEFMEANSELAPTLFFEFAEEAIESLGPLESESLKALSELGFKFSLDHVTSLNIDFETLAEMGFGFVKVDAQTMLETEAGDGARVHPEDLSKLASRFGIELIVEKIEGEKTVVNILDYDIGLAQGFLFARPRLVREEGMGMPFSAAA